MRESLSSSYVKVTATQFQSINNKSFPQIKMLCSLNLPAPSSSSITQKFNSQHHHHNHHSSSPSAPLYLKFRTAHRENLQYLKAIGVIDPSTKPHQLPSPDAATHILSTVNFLKSKGFSEPAFARLAFLSPQLFSIHFHPTDIDPVFQFLETELHASAQESQGLITKCPHILFSDVEFCLRPTLNYLRQLGVAKLNLPTSLNAHLLKTRVEKLRSKVKFLKSIGFSHQEAARACARLPAIFKYSIDNNLKPKYEYLVQEMELGIEELKEFPQYFGFSLHKRIVPRHVHLKERNVCIKLNRMLIWSDDRFYSKWK